MGKDYPIVIPQTDKPPLEGGKELQIKYSDLEEQLRIKFRGTFSEIDETCKLRQVVIREDSIGFVFDEGEL